MASTADPYGGDEFDDMSSGMPDVITIHTNGGEKKELLLLTRPADLFTQIRSAFGFPAACPLILIDLASGVPIPAVAPLPIAPGAHVLCLQSEKDRLMRQLSLEVRAGNGRRPWSELWHGGQGHGARGPGAAAGRGQHRIAPGGVRVVLRVFPRVRSFLVLRLLPPTYSPRPLPVPPHQQTYFPSSHSNLLLLPLPTYDTLMPRPPRPIPSPS